MPGSQTNRLLGICFETCFLASTRITSCLKNMTTVGFVSQNGAILGGLGIVHSPLKRTEFGQLSEIPCVGGYYGYP